MIVAILSESKQVHQIWRQMPYREGNRSGEVDILTHNYSTGWWHFYEVKSHYNPKSHEKAMQQFERFCQAYPNRKIKGIYVSHERTMRLRVI